MLVQNFAAKIATGARRFNHITPFLQELAWKPVTEQIQYRDQLLTFKCLDDMAPSYLTRYLSLGFFVRSSVHECNTRNKKIYKYHSSGQVSAKEPLNFKQQNYETI